MTRSSLCETSPVIDRPGSKKTSIVPPNDGPVPTSESPAGVESGSSPKRYPANGESSTVCAAAGAAPRVSSTPSHAARRTCRSRALPIAACRISLACWFSTAVRTVEAVRHTTTVRGIPCTRSTRGTWSSFCSSRRAPSSWPVRSSRRPTRRRAPRRSPLPARRSPRSSSRRTSIFACRRKKGSRGSSVRGASRPCRRTGLCRKRNCSTSRRRRAGSSGRASRAWSRCVP